MVTETTLDSLAEQMRQMAEQIQSLDRKIDDVAAGVRALNEEIAAVRAGQQQPWHVAPS